MKDRGHKIFWGVLLLLSAIVLVLYGMGFGGEAFGIPLYKIILGIVIFAFTLSRIIFGTNLRERLRIFTLLSLLFWVFEKEIGLAAGYPDGEIINNMILLVAGILADSAVSLLVPKKKIKGHFNKLSSATHYIDVSKNTQSFIENKMGDSAIFYQNTDLVPLNTVVELTIDNKMGNISIHIPDTWVVDSKVVSKMGAIQVRPNTGNYVTFILKGENKMGNIEVVSP